MLLKTELKENILPQLILKKSEIDLMEDEKVITNYFEKSLTLQ